MVIGKCRNGANRARSLLAIQVRAVRFLCAELPEVRVLQFVG